MINIVADSILENKKFHFDIQHRRLYRNDSAVLLIFRVKTHYVFELNRISKRMNAFATFIWVDFTHDWHQLLAHVNNEVVQHLITGVKEVKLIDKELILKINKCKECTLFKVHRSFRASSRNQKRRKNCFFTLHTTSSSWVRLWTRIDELHM